MFVNGAGMVDGMEKSGYPMFMSWTQVFFYLWIWVLSLENTISFYAVLTSGNAVFLLS